jgi:glycerophosphoryl diester phosphodiesterase
MSLLLDPANRLVIAHRGNSMHCPEDTPESFRSGLALGADALEFDVRLAADGTPMVIHDATLERTTDGHGPVRAHSVAALQSLDAGAKFTPDGGRSFPWRGRGVRIATFEEVLEEFEAIPFVVELKIAEAAQPVLRLLKRFGVERRCIVGSFKDSALAPFRAAGVATGASRVDMVRLYTRALLPGGPATLPFQALLIPPWYYGLPLPLGRFAAMGRRAGIPTHVWTVDDPQQARRLWAAGVNGIMSNDPAVMITASREIPPHG